MMPSQAFINRIGALLAADATTLNSATANKVHLAAAAFVPAPTLLIGSFTEATFAGYAALLAGIGPAQNFFDPATGNTRVQVLEPAGGWHWQTTTAVGLPQTIFGFYFSDNGSVNLWGCALFATNVVLTAAAQGIDIANVNYTLPAIPLT